MLTLARLLAAISVGYVGYCDANVARQPNQVTLVLSEHSSQPGADFINGIVIYVDGGVSTSTD